MAPSKSAIVDQDYNWSEMLSCLRNDIECFFGMMTQGVYVSVLRRLAIDSRICALLQMAFNDMMLFQLYQK